MFDQALYDFMERFGDDDPNKEMVQNQTNNKPMYQYDEQGNRIDRVPVSSVNAGIQALGATMGTPESAKAELFKSASGVDFSGAEVGGGEAAKGLGGIEGGGPGKAGGAILQGTMQGKQFADSLGLKDPISQGVAMLGGGLISTFAHKSAMKEWVRNQHKENLKENQVITGEREEDWAMSQGLKTLGNLKDLRKKQLGILS